MHNKDRSDQPAEKVQQLHEAEKKAIADVVSQQVKRGIHPICSGELERSSFVSGFYEALDGIEIKMVESQNFRTEHPIMVSCL